MSNETCRDLKLMSSVLGVEHYALLALGAFTVSHASRSHESRVTQSRDTQSRVTSHAVTLVFRTMHSKGIRDVIALRNTWTAPSWMSCQSNPVLLLPWLFMGLLVLLLEAFLFGSRLFYEGINMSRSELLFAGALGWELGEGEGEAAHLGWSRHGRLV